MTDREAKRILPYLIDRCHSKAEETAIRKAGTALQERIDREKGCSYCTPSDTSAPSRPKHSYDDEDGMLACVHPSKVLPNGYQSQSWWLTVNFRGEQRDFRIEVCPFCGKRLVPLKENIIGCTAGH